MTKGPTLLPSLKSFLGMLYPVSPSGIGLQLTTLLNWSIFGPVFAFRFHIPSLLSVLCWDIPKEPHTQAFIPVSVSLGTQPKTNVSNAHEFLISIRTPMSTFSLVEGD